MTQTGRRHRVPPQLSWSHYRALMRVQDDEPREFHENEAAECGWTKSRLERQIQSGKATSKISLEIDWLDERLKGGTALRGI